MIFGPSGSTGELTEMTVCAIHKCRFKLYHAKKKPKVSMIQKGRITPDQHHHLFKANDHLKWIQAKQKLFCGQTSHGC